MKTLYDVLDIRADDDAESVKKAFRKAVKANHPDLNAGDPDAQARHAQIIRANIILRDPQLRAVYDRMLEFEERQYRPQSKLVAISNAAYSIAAHTIFACVLAFVLAGGAYKLFKYVSETSDVTARASVTAAAVPPVAPAAAAEHPKVEAAGQPKAVGFPKPYAAALGAPVDVAADVKTAVDAALGRPKAAAAPPPPSPVIASERHDEPAGAGAVAPNSQTPTAAGLADGKRSPDKRLQDARALQLDPSTPAIQPLDRAIQPLDSEQVAMLLQRGRELLRTGDIAGARLAFQALADAGNVEAVLALGKTFDPRYLAQHYVVGVVGDEAKARAWYQRAMELGSREAKDILAHMATK
jgi:TPR repeat protein